MKTSLAVLRTLVLAVFAARALAQVPDALKHSLFDPSIVPQSGAAQGSSVASDGDFVVVGAPLDDSRGYDAGIVKVYHAITGALLYILDNPAPTQLDLFGNAVAISGTRVVVGARGSDIGGEDRGRAYLYDLASPAPAAPILTFNNPDDHIQSDNHNFGFAVAISGTTVVISAIYAQVAYVYDLTGATPSIPRLEFPDPTPEVHNDFGTAAAVSGTAIAIGTRISYPLPGVATPEAVFVFDLTAAEPIVARLVLHDPRPTPNSGFGETLAMNGSHLIVGASRNSSQAEQAGSAYLFDLASLTPTEPLYTFDQPGAVAHAKFGAAVASAGRRILIGAPRSDDPGSPETGDAYLYDLDSATPTVPAATLPHPNPSPGAYFGGALAMTSVRAVIGSRGDDTAARDAGAAYVYALPIASPAIPAATLNTPSLEAFHSFGGAVAVSGTLLVVGASPGIAYVYDRAGAMPATPLVILPNPRPGVPDGFGRAVAISGTRVIIGATGDDLNDNDPGRAYVFDMGSLNTAVPVLTLVNPDPNDHDDFGASVAISGTSAVIGAPYDDTSGPEAGSAYVYDFASATPEIPVLTLNNPGPEVISLYGEAFGVSVAMDGTRVAVGARFDNTNSARVGTVFVYDLGRANPAIPLHALRNPSPTGFDDFATSLAIEGTRLLAGAFQYAEQIRRVVYRRGRAYLFDLASAQPNEPVLTIESPFAGRAAINPPPGSGTIGIYESGFGSAVGISGTRLLIGAYADINGIEGAGSAFLYDTMSPEPAAPVGALTSPQLNYYENFGAAAAIDGDTVAVGAPGNSTNGSGRGAVFHFGPGPFSLFRINELGNAFAPALGDADGDRLENVVEYALILPPKAPNVIPIPTATSYAEGERLRLFVARDPLRNDVTMEVQATSDLAGPWATVAASVRGAPFSGPGYVGGDSPAPGVKTVEIRDVANIEATAQRFMRVRVSY